MPADSPPSLLITPDLRRRLQQRYEEAVQLLNQQPVDRPRVHRLLGECLRADPGNILYLDALFANLRQWGPEPRRAGARWQGGWVRAIWQRLSGQSKQPVESVPSTQYSVLGDIDESSARQLLARAPDLLLDQSDNPAAFQALAQACAKCDLDEAELRYLLAARKIAPDDPDSLRMLARSLSRQGRFEEARPLWDALVARSSDAEAAQAAQDLQLAPAGADPGLLPNVIPELPEDPRDALALARLLAQCGFFDQAERLLSQAQAALGGDLAVREQLEELQLARSNHRLLIARRRAEHDRHPKAQALVERLETEHNRQEIDVFHLRSERLPGDMPLRLELARRLKKAGNFSGAIQRLEEARRDPALAAWVLLELGECWQHLRQFPKALDFYREAAAAASHVEDSPALVAALYRRGALAAAMNHFDAARESLQRVVALDPGYKDARERLDKLKST